MTEVLARNKRWSGMPRNDHDYHHKYPIMTDILIIWLGSELGQDLAVWPGDHSATWHEMMSAWLNLAAATSGLSRGIRSLPKVILSSKVKRVKRI